MKNADGSFLLTPLRKGRRSAAEAMIKPFYFYSRPYARGDQQTKRDNRSAQNISTHAPTQGATRNVQQLLERRDISTHAPTQGATSTLASLPRTTTNFYSRPYARGDETFMRIMDEKGISTHAPTQGATRPAVESSPARVAISTHAPTQGATGVGPLCSPARYHFYSRPYARGDLGCADVQETTYHFYSRPYARGDGLISSCCAIAVTFLLTPLREGRQQFFIKPQVDLYDKLLKIHIF